MRIGGLKGWGRRALLGLLLLGPAAATAPREASATVVVALDVDALGAAARTVAIGRVADLRAERVGGRIVTVVALSVSDVLKGPATDRLEFRVLGGSLDGLAQWVPGEARFAVGEEVAVFLEGEGPDARLVGLGQGRFGVERGPEGLVLTRGATPDGLSLVSPAGQALAPGGAPWRLPVEALRTRLGGRR